MIQLFPGNKSEGKIHCHADSKKENFRVFGGLGFGFFLVFFLSVRACNW